MKYIISILLIAVLASCKTGKNAKSQDLNTLYKKWEALLGSLKEWTQEKIKIDPIPYDYGKESLHD